MPPKKQDAKSLKGQQRAADKEKAKIVEDKTFGLKNKNKSKAVQKKIKGIQQQVTGNNKDDRMKEQQQLQQKEAKKSKAQQDALLASLFRGTENVKKITVPENEPFDPMKSRQEQKIDLYVDQREQKREMDDWDQAKLEEVVKTKHVKQAVLENNSTDIICKHFLDAVEKRIYGWFWNCPNGGDSCKYKHCLPPGFVLKKDMPAEDPEDEEPIEEVIERLRAELPAGGTPVTKESFEAWKKKKEEDRLAEIQAAREAAAKKPGKGPGATLSGRDLFTFDPSLFIDDAGAASDADYDEDEESYKSEEESDEADEEVDEAESENEDEQDTQSDTQQPPTTLKPSEPSQPSVAPLKEELFLNDDELPDDLDGQLDD